MQRMEMELFMGGPLPPSTSAGELTFQDVEQAVAPFLHCVFVRESLMDEAKKVLCAHVNKDLVRLHPIPDWVSPDGAIEAFFLYGGRRDRCPICQKAEVAK